MAEQLVEINQQLENTNEAIALFGVNDAHLKVIERELNVSIVTRGETVHVSGAVETVTLVEKSYSNYLLLFEKVCQLQKEMLRMQFSSHNKEKLLNLKSYMKKKSLKRQKVNPFV